MTKKAKTITLMATAGVAMLCLVASRSSAFAQGPSASALSLNDVIMEVMGNNPEIGSLRDALRAKEEATRAEGWLDDPVFRIDLEEVSTKEPLNITPGNSMATRYSISQTLPYPGKLSLKEGIAAKEAAIEKARLSAMGLEKVFMAKETYYDYAYLSLSIGIVNEIKEVLSYMGKIAESKYSTGTASQQDVIKINIESSMAASELITLGADKAASAARLNTLMGRPVVAALPEPEGFPEKDAPGPADALADGPVDLTPDVRMAGLDVERAGLAKELADKNYYPDFMLGAAPVQRDGSFEGFDVMFQVNIPIWRGRYRGMAGASAATRSSLVRRLESERNRKALEIREAGLQLKAALDTRTLYETTLTKQAALSFEAALRNYQSGKGDFLTLLDTERELKKVRLAALKAKADYWKKAAALEKAVGAGATDATVK